MCEVEVDPTTGVVTIVRHAAVDDVGRAINPLTIDGQTHGGVVQGIGQALMEDCHYDPQSGQLLAGSFMDYAMPRAVDVPFFDTEITEVPEPHQPARRQTRQRGAARRRRRLRSPMPSSMAIAGLGVRHIEIPATPERIWRAIRDAS